MSTEPDPYPGENDSAENYSGEDVFDGTPDAPLPDFVSPAVVFEALKDVDAFLVGTHADRALAGSAFQLAVGALLALLQTPVVLEVTEEHRRTGVALVSAYLDLGKGHGLLAEVLTDLDGELRRDPQLRVGLLAALAQLVGDALTVAVAASSTLEEISTTSPSDLAGACLHLLQQIALVP
jgi:hypothetical protein